MFATSNLPTSRSNEPELISVVVPMYNERSNIASFLGRLIPVLQSLGPNWEIICINDGSVDDTLAVLLDQRVNEPRITVIDLSRNFGKECALSAGLAQSRGDVVVTIDADLQHPPEAIAEMLQKWRDGYEMVFAQRHQRIGQSLMHRLSARFFYFIMRMLSDVPLAAEAGDFRLLDRCVVNAINGLSERQRFMKGIFAWVGFTQIGIVYRQEARAAGTSSWRPLSLIQFAFDGLTAFSTFPLTVWMILGALVSGMAFFYILVRLIYVALNGVDVPGYESTIVIILFLGGFQLLGLGVLGSYLGRVFGEVKRRPLYIVRKTHGPATDDKTAPLKSPNSQSR